MLPLTQSPFLQALGYSIVNSLWQFALLWLLYVLVNTTVKLSSHQKYLTGYLLQTAGFVWFIFTFTFYFKEYTQWAEIFFPLKKSYSLYLSYSNALSPREKSFAWIIKSEKLLPYLSVAYLVLLVFSAVRWIKAYNLTQSIRTKGLHGIEVKWQLFVKELSNQLGIKHEVRIFLSEMVKSPLTIGFFKPLILIPLASINQLNTDQMEAVILHELAHIRRFDYLFNLLLAVIETTLFFNPFMILIARHIKRERENCCDDWVLQYNYNAASYAGALLKIATSQSSSYLLALKAADNKQVLLNRIKRMIEKKEKSFFNYKYQLIALFVMITVLSSLALISSKHKTAVVSAKPKVVSKQMLAKTNQSYYPILAREPLLKKPFRGDKKQQFEKNQQKNLHFDSLLKSIDGKNWNTNISNLQNDQSFMTSEVDPVLFRNNASVNAEAGIEEANMKLDEMLSGGFELKEQEIALAEEKFKNLAVNLFKEKKTAFSQKKVVEQMKEALEQLNAVKIQLELSERSISINNENKNVVLENQIANILRFAPYNAQELKSVTSKLASQIADVKKRYISVTKPRELPFSNCDLKLPKTEFNLSFENVPHSFSYEFSEKPEIKTVITNHSNSPERVRGTDRFEENRRDFTPDNTSPAVYEQVRKRVIAKKNIQVIKI